MFVTMDKGNSIFIYNKGTPQDIAFLDYFTKNVEVGDTFKVFTINKNGVWLVPETKDGR